MSFHVFYHGVTPCVEDTLVLSQPRWFNIVDGLCGQPSTSGANSRIKPAFFDPRLFRAMPETRIHIHPSRLCQQKDVVM
eukprot:7612688-Pyramimonas_sp.AAC.1